MPDLQNDIVNYYTDVELGSSGETILVNNLGEQLLASTEAADTQTGDTSLPDNNAWVRHTFITEITSSLAQGSRLSDQDRANRRFSTASIKYTDTSPGGNKMINPPPAFTRYADIRPPRIFGDTPRVTLQGPAQHLNYGLGRYYSEAIDDNAQVIHMRFGVGSFNSLTQFFTSFYSGDLAAAARAARYTDNFFQKWMVRVGNVIGLAIAPLFIIPNALLLIGSAARFFLNWPSSKFYYLKPAMPQYWSAVTNIVNQMSVNSGLVNYVNTSQSQAVLKGGYGAQELTATTEMNIVGKFLPPGILHDSAPYVGLIDVYALANRTNRLDIQFQNRMAEAFKQAGPNDSWFDVIRTHLAQSNVSTFEPGVTHFEQYVQRFFDQVGSYSRENDPQSQNIEKDIRQKGFSADGKTYDGSKTADPGFIDYFISNLNDGSDFVSYRVDYTGQVQENFSSNTAESSLATKINSMSRAARETRFNLADGNVGGGIGAVVDGIKGVISGVAEVIHIEGLASLAGSAFVDIPKMWNESITSLPKSNYNITLISPYGNQISQLFNIWIPLASLIAGALPLATGKQSHTSPFLVELHDRGRCMTRLGIIDNMSITRGTSNLGFNNEGHALAVEVSFSVLDLSSIMAMPINQGFDLLNPTEGLFDGDNAFSDYLMTLSGMKLADTIYRIPLLKYQINRKVADMKTFFSASHVASYLSRVPGIELLGAAMKGTDKQ
jgi:hypothetical protein